MRTIKHPLSGAVYDLEADGTIRVAGQGRQRRHVRQERQLARRRRQAGRPAPVPVDRRQGAAQPVPAGRCRDQGRGIRPRRGVDPMTLTESAPGAARSPATSYQELLDRDSRPENVPVVLRWQSNEFLGSKDIPRERYTSRAFYELEKERMWKRSWQMACREEDIPDVGDTLVYDICDLSILVVRTPSEDDQGVLQRLPAPRPAAQGARLQQHRAALRVPRLLLEPRRHAQAGAGGVGLPPRRADEWSLPEVQGRLLGRVRVRQHGPRLRAVRVVHRRLRRALGEVAAGAALQGGARRQGVRDELEGAPGSVHGGVPRRRHPPAAARRHRRREQPVRLAGQLQPGDHAERHAEPAHQVRPDASRRCSTR